MVEYQALLTTAIVGFGAGIITTLVLVLLVVIYNNLKAATDGDKEDDDNGMIVPLSSLLGGGAGGPAPYTMADIMKLKQAMAGQGGPPEGEKKDANLGGGNYI
jgi:multisubunit Na+/H+ antiporter MnhB subunit